jgi:carbamate kinase
MSGDSKLIVLAVGGNSLILDEKHQTVHDQYLSALETCKHVAPLLKEGHRLVITHGNGPQVGFILRRSEIASKELHMVPLDSCGADTQGAIGYNIQQAMWNIMRDWPKKVPVATVVTQVLVDRNDPAFQKPSKPIGTFMDKETAEDRKAKEGWNIVEDAGRGYRRVVASPLPKEVIELGAIQKLLDSGFVVVAVGGGGIPVVINEKNELVGTDAVIDKDFASSLLANNIKADLLIISTAVEKVYINFKKPDQKALDKITVAEAKKYIEEGHFAPGSMLPKIKAVVQYIEKGGQEGLITDPPNLARALRGETGTRIVP